MGEIERAGVEPVLADPDRIATIAPAFDYVSVACVLLGSATGPVEQVRALHGSRLEMLLTKMLDTTVRGLVYETAGTVDRDVLDGAAARLRDACVESRIPYALLDTAPADHAAWLNAATDAVESVLEQR